MAFDRKAWRQQWKAANPDKVAAQIERDNARRRARPATETAEERAERLRKLKEYRDDWRARNPDKIQKYVRDHKEWRAENHEHFRTTAHAQSRKKVLEKTYGITPERYEQLLAAQGGKCACCRTDQPAKVRRKYSWRVDHCHKTGKVRGLLCHNCNVSLGLIKEDTSTLMRMVTYLCTHA